MKKSLYLLCVIVVSLCLLCSTSLALTPIGVPAATLKQDQFATGFSYSMSKFDVDLSAMGFTGTAEDVEVNTYLVNLIFGAHENWEFQIDLGMSDTEYMNETSKGDFTYGFGVRSTLFHDDKYKLGSVVTIHFYDVAASGSYNGINWQESDKWTEVLFAVGPSYTEDRLCLYGGPFLHFINGSGKYSENGFSVSGDIEQEDIFGGFAGALIEVAKNTHLGLEYQMTGSANNLSLSVRFLF